MIDVFLHKYAFQGNWVDLVFLGLLIYFIFASRGFIESLLELIGFLISLFAAYRLYSLVGGIMVHQFAVPRGIANATGFFIVWFFIETFLFILSFSYLGRFFLSLRLHAINRILKVIPAILHALIIFLFFVSLLFAFPIRGTIKADILESRTGPYFVNLSQSIEKNIKQVFGQAVSDSLNFLTIKPRSDETIDLGFTVPERSLKRDSSSEQTMLSLVNMERKKNRLRALSFDETVSVVARKYAREMFVHGFFSHTSRVDGSTVLERVTRESIIVVVVGENLAFAPDVYLAHQGLMNSPGHRANILMHDYERVGIGVIDGGVYGRMFVQIFTD